MRTTILPALCFFAFAAEAEVPKDVVRAEILTGWRDGATHHAGLRLQLAPGWKTYWRAPGDAGIPPVFDWGGSENASGVTVAFPVPKVHDQNGLRSIGYEGHVILPLAVTATSANAPIRLSGTIDLGVCEEICIPVRLSIAAELPAGGGSDAALAAAMADRPMTANEAGVQQVTCEFRPIADGMTIEATLQMPRLSRGEIAVIEVADPRVWVSEPDMSREDGTLTLVADAVPPEAEPFFLGRDDVRITIIGGGQAVDIRGCR